jgi:hypothetical protein
MKYLNLFFLLLLLSCNNLEEDKIRTFEKTLGQERSELINKVIIEFEENLKTKFRTDNINQAYYRYFLRFIDNNPRRLDIFDIHRFNEIKKLMVENGLEKEIFLTPSKVENDSLKFHFIYTYYRDNGIIDTIEVETELILPINDIPFNELIIEEEKRKIMFNKYGKYIQALEKINSMDSSIVKYIDYKKDCGYMADYIFAHSQLYNTVDVENYFIKRIILIEHFY